MKSIKRALCSVLVCFGAFMFCTGTANAAEGAETQSVESADNNFVDNSVTDNFATQNVVISSFENLQTTIPEAALAQPIEAVVPMLLETSATTEVADAVEAGDEMEDDTASDNKKKSSKNNKKQKKYNKADLRLLAAIISCEANNEPYAGKLGVGIVVMNRVKAKAFPDTVKGVIYQKFQFSPVRNGALKKALARYDAGKFTSANSKQCIKAAKEALDGVKTVKHGGKKKSMKKYHYFSGSLRNAKYRISGHMFK